MVINFGVHKVCLAQADSCYYVGDREADPATVPLG